MDRATWWATVHSVTKSQTWLKWLSTYFCIAAAAAAKSLQSCPTLCDPIDGSPLSSSVPGILQARILEWIAISFSNAWKWKVKVKSLSHARLLAIPWTTAYQAPPSMGFSRQEYWSGVPLPSPTSVLGTIKSSHFGNSQPLKTLLTFLIQALLKQSMWQYYILLSLIWEYMIFRNKLDIS